MPDTDLVRKDASNAFLVFRRGDGIDTYYKINSVSVLVDVETIGRNIEANSAIDLVGFARTQQISPNIFDFVPHPESTPLPDLLPPPVETAPQGMVRLNIDGYADVSDIFLDNESLKQKDENKLNIQLATHSISLGENLGNKRSSVDYEIIDHEGKVWVRVIQKEVTIEGRLGGRFGNNHPDKQYLAGLNEDCNIYLPLDRAYKIKATSQGNMDVDFWIHHPWSLDGQERRIYRRDLGVGQSDSFTINANDLRNMPSYQRAIKININGKL